MPYGAANRSGRPSREQAHAILDAAVAGGIRTLDTAQGYGDSEAVIGEWLGGRDHVEVVTKVAAGGDVRASRELIGPALTGVLAHEPEDVRRWDGTGLPQAVAEGVVRWAGVSVYTPDEFRLAVATAGVDAIQAPFNVADRRLVELLPQASAKRVFLRSAYLQGLLVMEGEPPAFATEAIARWRDACARHGLRPQVAALQWVKRRAPGTEVLFGAESEAQVLDTIAAWEHPAPADDVLADLEAAFPRVDETLVDPRRWTP